MLVKFTSNILTKHCGDTLLLSMFNLRSLVLDSMAAARLAATKSPIVVFAKLNSSKNSLFRKDSHIARNLSSLIGILLRLAVFSERSPDLILLMISSGSVRLGSSGGNSFNGVAFVTPDHPVLGSGLSDHFSDCAEWYCS